MSKGILLIALGHESYKRMAVTLAASIRVNDPDLKIAIATDCPMINVSDFLFDKTIIVPEKELKVNGNREYIRAKLLAYKLSPYEETIFLDVDQVLIPGKKISPLFDELAGVDVTFANTGVAGASVWVDINEIKEKFSGGEFWNFHSELFYFRKGDKAKEYFSVALKVYDREKLNTAIRFAGGRMADELAFQIASIKTGIYPHIENWTPNFWYVRHPNLRGKFPYQLNFLTYSIGGSYIPTNIKNNYNNLAAYYFAKLKLQNPYKAKDKRSFLPERAKI